jgi:hypothetical protein
MCLDRPLAPAAAAPETAPMTAPETTTIDALPPLAQRLLLIDAMNVAYWCGQPPSLRFPLSLLNHRLAAGLPALLYFDASARYRLKTEAAIYDALAPYTELFVEVPSGRTADGVMLRHARARGGCIVSRDRYRDYRSRYRKLIDDPTRLLTGAVSNERLYVPALAIGVAVAASADEALQQLAERQHALGEGSAVQV